MFNGETCSFNECVGNPDYDLATGEVNPVHPVEAVAIPAARAESIGGWFASLFKSGAKNALSTDQTPGYKELSAARQNSVNKYMNQYGKGAPGAKKLLEDIKANGAPRNMDIEAFKAYRNQINEVGGSKPVTSNSEVFKTRVEILNRILGD